MTKKEIFSESKDGYLTFDKKNLKYARKFFISSKKKSERTTIYYYTDYILVRSKDVLDVASKKSPSYNYL